jgi:pimeloyl-ACP methyl ester carboxylesterase
MIALISCAALLSCGDSKKTPSATPTPQSVPSPVATPPATRAGFTLGDSSLETLPGSSVEHGQLGGMLYQIEIPDHWNGRLVMYTHGNDIDTTLHVYPPQNAPWLIAHGYAWATSSYTMNVDYVSGVAADETASLWDFFVKEHGRPHYTYAEGDSMGGAAAFTAAERYPDRYDGSLSLCPDSPPSRVEGDFFYAAAYAAGVTQADYDAEGLRVIDTKIKPALRDPATRSRFDALWTDISGGPRPFVADGVDNYMQTLWTTAIGNIQPGIDGNDGVEYKLGPSAGVSSDDFNRGVIRVKTIAGADKYADVNRITGDIKIPTLTVQPTGDAETVFSSSQELRRRVDSKGKGDLLVQRAIQSPRHCFDRGMTDYEIGQSFEALVDWVENGKKPEGEDLLGDLTNAGAKFTTAPRLGSDAASRVAGAERRVTLTGTTMLDGQPVEPDFLWAEVRNDGVHRACSFEPARFDDNGRYEITIASDAEVKGCGAADAQVYVALFKDGERYISEQPVAWPATGGSATFDATFSTAHSAGAAAEPAANDYFGTTFFGSLLKSDGSPAPTGTTVEAFIGDTLCGRKVVAPVVMVFDQPGSYEISIASPASVPACTAGGSVSFKIDGKPIPQTGANDSSRNGHPLDLVVPAS